MQYYQKKKEKRNQKPVIIYPERIQIHLLMLVQLHNSPAQPLHPISASEVPLWIQLNFPHIVFKDYRDQSAIEGLLLPVCGCQHSIQK